MGRRILVLGGGPSGLAAAYRLARDDRASVVLLEQGDGFGGLARTIAWNGHRLDFGSHRLDPGTDSRVLADLRELLAGDLVERPGRARIRLIGRWVPYPLTPRSFLARLRLKILAERLPAEVCRKTLFSGRERFLYPRKGFGQICEAFAKAAMKHGAELRLRHRVTGLSRESGGWTVTAEHRGETAEFAADEVWSTVTLPQLVRILGPDAPESVRNAAERISFRGLLLLYLEIETDRLTEYDVHHLPSEGFLMTRVSEPKVIADRRDPAGRTVICAEIPCEVGGDLWDRSEVELASLVTEDLHRAEIPLPRLPRAAHVERVPHAFPAARNGDRTVDDWLREREGLVVLGRQGHLMPDRTHEALAAAYDAVDSLT
jgi:protoporphyrinogen oxidase